MDDASIIELLRKRDESALTELRDRYDRLCRYIAGNVLSQREDIEECVSSAYYEVWNSIPPAAPDDLKSYLCKIVRNIAINRYEYNSAAKRDSRFTVSLDEIGDCVPATPDENIALSDLADAKPLPALAGRRPQARFRPQVHLRRLPRGHRAAVLAQ